MEQAVKRELDVKLAQIASSQGKEVHGIVGADGLPISKEQDPVEKALQSTEAQTHLILDGKQEDARKAADNERVRLAKEFKALCDSSLSLGKMRDIWFLCYRTAAFMKYELSMCPDVTPDHITAMDYIFRMMSADANFRGEEKLSYEWTKEAIPAIKGLEKVVDVRNSELKKVYAARTKQCGEAHLDFPTENKQNYHIPFGTVLIVHGEFKPLVATLPWAAKHKPVILEAPLDAWGDCAQSLHKLDVQFASNN